MEDWLLENGHDVRTVRSINPKAPDVDILLLAVSEGRMVITMDKDFGELVYNSGKRHSGVLLLRLEAANGAQKLDIVKRIMLEYGSQIKDKFCVFQDGLLRIKS